MFLSNSSVARPIAMSCLIIGLALLGGNAYRKLGLELLPKMDIPYVTVITQYPGGTPSDIEIDVAKRIEDAVASIEGLKHITTTCLENVCQIAIEFQLGTDVDVASNDVRAKVDAILDDFPAAVKKPVILKIDINAKAIATLALTGTVSIAQLYDYADQTLSDRFSSIPGVANVDLLGGAPREVHILLDRNKLASAGLSSLDVLDAVSKGVVTVPAGRVKDKGEEYNIRFDAEYSNIAAIGGLQIAGRDGARRYVGDLGEVVEGTEELRQLSFIDGEPAIGIKVVKKSDANAVEVVNALRRAVDNFQPLLPGGMKLVWVTDDGAYIQASVDSTMSNIWQGVALTAIVLFFFLFNIRTTFVVAITMPLTIIISLFAMQLSGFTMNNSTLLALGLSVGMLVTNSIVVLESIAGHFAGGNVSSWKAAKDGAADVAVAVMASAGTNVVVLLPIGLMGSIIGIFFRPFALTTLYVNIASLFISFTLTPILSALFLRKENKKALTYRAGQWFNVRLDLFARKMTGVLRVLTRRRWQSALILLIAFVLLVQALSLVPSIGFTMFPQVDKGEMLVKLEYPIQQNLYETANRVKEVEEKIRTLPDVVHWFTSIGKVDGMVGKASEGTYLASILVKLTDKTNREQGINAYLDMVRVMLDDHTNCIANASIPGLMGGEDVPIDVALLGDDLEALESSVLRLVAGMNEVPGFIGIDTTVREKKRESQIEPRRAQLADAGLAVSNLGMLLRTNLEGTKAAQYKTGARSLDIRIKFKEEQGKEQVEAFQVPLVAAGGATVPITQYAEIKEKLAPILISRFDKMRVAKVYSFLDPDYPLGTALNEIQAIEKREEILPPGYGLFIGGVGELLGEMVEAFLEAGIIAIVLTYLVLAAILESFTRPFYIMTTLPMGLMGILWALWLTNYPLNMFVLLGAVLLIGIVVNNAILIIDHMQQLIDKGMHASEAILQAVALEFRPVIMITLAAVLGMLPLAVASGLGSEMTVGIGTASVGGIAISSLMALLIMPVMFLLFNPPPKPGEPGSALSEEEAYRQARRSSSRVIIKLEANGE